MKILRNDIIEWYSDNLCANALLNKSPKIIAATKIYAVSVTGIFFECLKILVNTISKHSKIPLRSH